MYFASLIFLVWNVASTYREALETFGLQKKSAFFQICSLRNEEVIEICKKCVKPGW